MQSPGFTKPTHGYGQPFGDGQGGEDLVAAVLEPGEYITDPERAEQLGLTVEAQRLREQEENWAGKGFERPAG